jgi:hypothetical protein
MVNSHNGHLSPAGKKDQRGTASAQETNFDGTKLPVVLVPLKTLHMVCDRPDSPDLGPSELRAPDAGDFRP